MSATEVTWIEVKWSRTIAKMKTEDSPAEQQPKVEEQRGEGGGEVFVGGSTN